MRLITFAIAFCLSLPALAEDDSMAQWGAVEKALLSRDSDAYAKAMDDLRSSASKSTEGKQIVNVVGDDGSVWRNVDDIDVKAKAVLRLLKQCDVYLNENSLEDLQRTCAVKKFDGSDWSRPLLPEAFHGLTRLAYLDEDAFLKPFNDKVTALIETKRSEKIAQEEQETKNQKSIEQKQKADDARREKDPKTWADRACNSQKLIDISKGTIKREQAGAKHSGIVNQRALYGAGQTIETMQQQQSQQKAEYKKLSGKDWSPSQCK